MYSSSGTYIMLRGGVFCVHCCITLGSAATLVFYCYVYWEENITIRNEVVLFM